jgi:phosphoglycolate phosphatase-like HAD superfamily hydrolase
MKTVIFDLDGTLCDISHRLHFIENGNKDWDGFYAACPDDVPKPAMIAFVDYHMLKNSNDNWIFKIV